MSLWCTFLESYVKLHQRGGEITNVEVNVGVTLRRDVVLEVGSTGDVVTVEANSLGVQTKEATVQRAVTLVDIDAGVFSIAAFLPLVLQTERTDKTNAAV